MQKLSLMQLQHNHTTINNDSTCTWFLQDSNSNTALYNVVMFQNVYPGYTSWNFSPKLWDKRYWMESLCTKLLFCYQWQLTTVQKIAVPSGCSVSPQKRDRNEGVCCVRTSGWNWSSSPQWYRGRHLWKPLAEAAGTLSLVLHAIGITFF